MRIFSQIKSESSQQKSEFEIGKRKLASRQFRSASRHFARAVAEEPGLKIEAADCLMVANRPRDVLKVLSVPNTKTPIECPPPKRRIELSIAAHHALAHQGSRFRLEHADAEISSLKALLCWPSDELDVWTRVSEAVADRYLHRKYGICSKNIRGVRPKPHDTGDSGARFFDLAWTIEHRLQLHDSKALDLTEEMVRYGPHGRSLSNSGAGNLLSKALQEFANEVAVSADADRALQIAKSIKRAAQVGSP